METVIETKTEMLPCELTDSEVMHRGQQAAKLFADRDAIETRLAGHKSVAKQQLEAIEDETAVLMRQIRTRLEDRKVPVIQRENFDDVTTPVVETVRIDTGEVIRTRPMTYDERQGKLVGIATPLRQEA